MLALPAWGAPPPVADDFDAGRIEAEGPWIERPLDENQIVGMMVDQTITQVGRRFTQGFAGAWRDLANTRQQNITIFERPSARLGSLIWVEQNFAKVYQTVLYPGMGNPQAVGAAAAVSVQQRIADIEADQVLFTDPDVGKAEF